MFATHTSGGRGGGIVAMARTMNSGSFDIPNEPTLITKGSRESPRLSNRSASIPR